MGRTARGRGASITWTVQRLKPRRDDGLGEAPPPEASRFSIFYTRAGPGDNKGWLVNELRDIEGCDGYGDGVAVAARGDLRGCRRIRARGDPQDYDERTEHRGQSRPSPPTPASPQSAPRRRRTTGSSRQSVSRHTAEVSPRRSSAKSAIMGRDAPPSLASPLTRDSPAGAWCATDVATSLRR